MREIIVRGTVQFESLPRLTTVEQRDSQAMALSDPVFEAILDRSFCRGKIFGRVG
jgi:hypothetical protein